MNKTEQKLVGLCLDVIDDLNEFESENACAYSKILQALIDDIKKGGQNE